VADAYITDEGVAFNSAPQSVLDNDSDADGDGLTAVLVSNPLNGTLAFNNNGTFVYTPNAFFNGTDQFTYRANDGQANSAVATVTITVNPISQLLFDSFRDGNTEIYMMNPDGSNQTRLTNDPVINEHPIWSPNGTLFLFETVLNSLSSPGTMSPDGSGPTQIERMNRDGTGRIPLTGTNANNDRPAWSPDGSRIAFVSSRDGNNEIYVMNADGSGQTRLTNNSISDVDPVWSPDGSRIAFVTEVFSGTLLSNIHVMNADGTGQMALTTSNDDHDPVWSPDSSRIAFASGRTGNDEIFVMFANGSSQLNVTNNPALDEQPAWSPNGAQIAFVTNRDGTEEIYRMNVNGSSQTRVTNHFAEDTDLAWSPDGTQIAFTDDGSGVFVVTLSNNAVTPLATQGNEGAPNWQPN
jgi:Tol biopolymer transport system component